MNTGNGPLTCGFAGLGAMGSGMARSILKAGISVVGYDVWKPSMDRFIACGGNCASSVEDLVKGCSVLVRNATLSSYLSYFIRLRHRLPPNAAGRTLPLLGATCCTRCRSAGAHGGKCSSGRGSSLREWRCYCSSSRVCRDHLLDNTR